MCVCPRAARGREARAPPPPAAHSAARGPPVRAHCSWPGSTGREKRPEPFRGSASAPPWAPRAGGLQGGSGQRPELAPGLSRVSGRSAPWGRGVAPGADSSPSFGTWDGREPGTPSRPHIPEEPSPARESLLLPPGAAGSPPRWRWGRGRPTRSVLLAVSRFEPRDVFAEILGRLSAPQPRTSFESVPCYRSRLSTLRDTVVKKSVSKTSISINLPTKTNYRLMSPMSPLGVS